jgi:hypothetical protein
MFAAAAAAFSFSFTIVETRVFVIREKKRGDVIGFFSSFSFSLSLSFYHLLQASYVKNGKRKNGGKKTTTH